MYEVFVGLWRHVAMIRPRRVAYQPADVRKVDQAPRVEVSQPVVVVVEHLRDTVGTVIRFDPLGMPWKPPQEYSVVDFELHSGVSFRVSCALDSQ